MRNKLTYIVFLYLLFANAALAQVVTDADSIKASAAIATEQFTDQAYLEQLDSLLQIASKDSSFRVVKQIDPDFKSKYLADKAFNYSWEKNGSFWSALKAQFARLLRALFGLSPDISFDFISIVIKIFCTVIILAALFFVVKIFLKHQGRWFLEKKNETLEIDVEDAEQLIHFADFQSLIEQAETHNDTRLSIRYYYLWLLKTLKDKELILWLPDKTNSDYLYEIKDITVKNRFSRLSYLYEYIWYGEFSINDTEYREAKAEFDAFLRKEAKHE